ncbi:hypothetical protein ATO12_23600 [Aquimarina atlantica]|uniref:Uncharacterized protein n=1 Tax=Aquimarina atlantica TaxID=1317122 RepID=A0A023BQV0_9FLAO|nr:DUF6261 family protein [Aquimarina atlantica]EZH72437.1 hypothetical protein ATO12_23600 [Aquimarina atlantica]
MFTTPTFYKFRNSEFIQYLTDVKKIVLQRDPQALQVVTQIDALNQQISVMDGVYKKQLGSTITQELEALDKRRDLAIIGIRTAVEAYTYHYDQTKQDAGKDLLQSIDQYGGTIARQNYQTETTNLRNLIQDWSTVSSLKSAITALGLADWAKELGESNDLFNTKYLERNTEYAVDSKVNVTELRDKAKESYTILINHITAHATLNPSKDYDTVVQEINTLTEQYNILVEKRGAISTDTDIEEEMIQE